MKERIRWIDSVKGIGILLIMLVHLNAAPEFVNYLVPGYVSMFFVASGITLKLHSDIRQDIVRKAKRILIPYFFYGLGIVLITVAVSIFMHKDPELLRRVFGIFYSRRCIEVGGNVTENQLLLPGGCAPLWFMTSFFVSYILVYLWEKCRKSYWLTTFYAVLAIAFCRLPVLLPWSLDVAPLGALFIITGLQYRQFLTKRRTMLGFLLIVALFAVFVYENGDTNMSLREYGNVGLFYFIGILEFQLFAQIFQRCEDSVVETLFAYVGRHSLRLMCIHMFIWVTIKDMLVSKAGEDYAVPMAYATLGIIFLADFIMEKLSSRYRNRIGILKYI